ncbi:MAG TPA: AMIN domain-containing protein, partial [Candidatus Binatia bacterium]
MARTSTRAERIGTEPVAAGGTRRVRSRWRGAASLLIAALLATTTSLALASPPFKPPPKRTRGLVRPTAEAAAPARVERVRYQADQQSTRVIVLLSRSVPYEVTVLPGEPSRGSERRVVLDFSNAKLSEDAMQAIGVEDGLLKQIRTGQFTARTARVVLDLASVTGHHVTTLDDPPRVVVDIAGKPTAAGRDHAPDAAESAPPERRPETDALAPSTRAPQPAEHPAPEVASRATAEPAPRRAAEPAAPRSAPEPAPAAKEGSARRPAAAEPNKPGAPGLTWKGNEEPAAAPLADGPARSAAQNAESAPPAAPPGG